MDHSYQILLLTNGIHALNSQITNNNADIAKLKNAQTNIIADQKELGSKRTLVTEPNLSNDTWQGKYATEFLEIREEVGNQFTNILQSQIETLLDNISSKIAVLENSNDQLSSTIISKRNEIRFLQQTDGG